ncbi:MAG: SDR family oxidoreductase [Bacteroides sp.]|nr:SDR family oxidoreductase [Bacteroides sp.]MCM1086497.1 SDR family oxidoreductase [Bacteroides sp.]
MENKPIIWITGASSGIGEALAYAYARQGARLILSSRKQAELERVRRSCAHPENHHIECLDLADPQSLDTAAKNVLEKFGYVDMLINNGGISQRSLVAETPLEVDRRIMQVDYFSGVQLAKAVLPSMLARGKGRFVAVSSIVGVFGFPQRSAYSAAKHAMHGFYETLRAENRQHGIEVTVVCPGRILTNVSLHALKADGSEYGVMDHAQANGITAGRCAERIVHAVRRNKKEVYVCRKDVLMVYFRRYIPALYYKLVGKVKPN